MKSIENQANCKTFKKADILYDRMWKGTINSMASYNAKLDGPKNNPMSIPRKFRTAKPKVGREFFEHDTRNNSECFSYTNSIRSDQKTSLYIDQCVTRNKDGVPIEKSVDQRSNESIDLNSTKSHHEINSNVTQYRSFVSKSHYHGFNYHSKFNSHQSNNTKLKKKLFKIQRQLRLQTVALRRQRVAGNWCCSCPCSSSKHGQIPNQFKHFDHHQYNGGKSNDCLIVCNNKLIKNANLNHPIHMQGLRSVVR